MFGLATSAKLIIIIITPPTKLSPYMDFGLPNTHFDMSFTFACLEEAVTQMVGWQSASCFVGGKLYAYVHLLTRMMIVLG